MATAADFASWAVQDLVIPLGGRDFRVRPPSVDDMGKLLACAVRGEVNLGLKKGPIPAGVQEVLDTIEPHEHPALGDAFQEMVDAGIHPTTIDKFAYYSVFYWARGVDYADTLAKILWAPRDTAALGAGEPAPKGS